VQKGALEQKLKAGDIVPVDIELYPSSTFFLVGESLQLIIATDEIIPSPPCKKLVDCNQGRHVLHFGGRYNSFLMVPKIPSTGK
jgi:predicted acyl esterase